MGEAEQPARPAAGLLRDLGVSTSRVLHREDPSQGLPFSLDDPLLASLLLARAERSLRQDSPAHPATLPSLHMLNPLVERSLPASDLRYSSNEGQSGLALVPVVFIPSTDDVACAIGDSNEPFQSSRSEARGFFSWILSMFR